jgi:stage III sporulation protein SpoIIIAA
MTSVAPHIALSELARQRNMNSKRTVTDEGYQLVCFAKGNESDDKMKSTNTLGSHLPNQQSTKKRSITLGIALQSENGSLVMETL